MIRSHEMPFGAAVLPQGGVRFRLWAPAARKVDLCIAEKYFPMKAAGEGWHELVHADAAPGTLYQYRIDGKQLVPDPASRFQPQDVDGPSEVIAPSRYDWSDEGWRSRPWNETVVYELHVGTFTPQGTYAGVATKLKQLVDTGITAIELLPIADFAGKRNWGYDGVLPYAPDSAYGRPEDLKALIEAAHQAGLMVFLDVVYNHFGPKGNYLSVYSPQFFTDQHKTPWGAAIDFAQPVVRQYFVHNVLYWLEEYGFDGLRFDAVHAIIDSSPRHILDEIRDSVPRSKHLVLENDRNQASILGPGKYNAQWNDDSHHGFHLLATGETDGYYVSYADQPARHLARCLAEGFSYQGEVLPFTKEPRGEKSAHLPASCFIDFLQNHDQVGNRALGERLLTLADEKKLKALSAIHLLAPATPMIFMGEEWGCRQPFLFFADFSGELGEAVRKGRQEEFSRFKSFKGKVPDPIAESTFQASTLDWSKADQVWLAHYKNLLGLRQKHIVPLDCGAGKYRMLGERAFEVTWENSRGKLRLVANCGEQPVKVDGVPSGEPLWSNGAPAMPWSVNWWLTRE